MQQLLGALVIAARQSSGEAWSSTQLLGVHHPAAAEILHAAVQNERSQLQILAGLLYERRLETVVEDHRKRYEPCEEGDGQEGHE